ncbi:MAG: ribosomal L7Ae/L30e/S12e/Gadd45 family protein [Candidatus Aenigmarchaeota archaeon]|nr:ribosomal L7Ae/L30e/S12e/Gadd45 family protein [Candidatus Aenigmarchaeota archaeon]
MMDLTDFIRTKSRENKVIIGYDTVMKFIKNDNPELIILANNFPDDKKKIIEYNAKIAKVEVKEYPNDSVNLGLVCGKPFPISVLAIRRTKK